MKKFLDFSLHFTLKEQEFQTLLNNFRKWCVENSNSIDIDQYDTVLHHCFMRKSDVIAKGWDTIVCDKLELICDQNICWNGTSQMTIKEDRVLMLQNLKRIGGLAIFVGDIKDGVKEEYDLVVEMGIPNISIS